MKMNIFRNRSNQVLKESQYSDGQKSYLKGEHQKKVYLIWCRILLFLSFLALWQMSADFGWIDSFYFSSPQAIGLLFISSDSSLLSHIGITLLESGISFILIILISVLIATFFWFHPSIGAVFEPFLIVLNSLPKSALAPLIIVWMGTGSKTIILCGVSVGIFGCILNLYQTFQQTDPERLKLIETLDGTKYHAFTKVVFPGSIPAFLSIAKVNIGLALVGVIIGEFLAGRRGLGYLIIYGSQTFQLNLVIMSIVILCFIAVFIYGLLGMIEKRIAKLR